MSAAVAKRLQEAADQLDAHLAADPAPALADLPEAMRAWADELNVPTPRPDVRHLRPAAKGRVEF